MLTVFKIQTSFNPGVGVAVHTGSVMTFRSSMLRLPSIAEKEAFYLSRRKTFLIRMWIGRCIRAV